MKVFSRILLFCVVLCIFGASLSLQAQYLQTNDEISLIQATNITDLPASSVRGVSDDGKRVVFESPANLTGQNPDLNIEVYVYEVDKRTFIQVTKTQHVYDPADIDKAFADRKILVTVLNAGAAISGDGTKIVFSSNSGSIVAGDAGKNDDGNQEIFLATLPLNSTSPSFQRVTNTPASTTASRDVIVLDNYSPTINFNGSLIAFVTTRQTLPGVTNKDALGQIVLFNTSNGTFTQITNKNEADAIDTFFKFKGFNSTPQLSGNGNVLVFISGFNHAPTASVNNADLNGEIFLYDVNAKTLTQLTATTGFAGYPASISQAGTLAPDRPVNILNPNTKHLSNDGNVLAFESAGDLEAGKNSDKTREVFLYNRTTGKFTQVTSNSNLPTTPTQADINKIDYDFTPGLSPNGQFLFFSSILNLVPVASGGTSGTSTDNADGSREVFRYEIATAKYRQLTYTPLSPRVLDQREALLYPNSNATGTEIFFTDDVDLIGDNPETSFEVFRAIIRPITTTSTTTIAVVNGASYASPDVATPANNPVAGGSIASIFGTGLADSPAATTRADLDFTLNGVSVTVAGIAARIAYVSPGQINFVVPDGVLAGDGVVFTVNNKGTLLKGTFKSLDASPGIFTVTQDGKGPGTVGCQIVTKDENGVVTGTSYPAPPCTVSTSTQDSYLLIFGTGIKYAVTASVVVTVTSGETSKDYTPAYAGPQNFFPGLDQINLLIPSDFPKGVVKVKVKATSGATAVESNEFTVTIN